jgi:prepilin-type processing-associated H-X9-DG protein
VREDRVEPTFGVCHPASNRFRHGRADVACDNLHFWSHHLHGANMAFADGSVHFLSYSLDKFLPALATRAGRRGGGLVAVAAGRSRDDIVRRRQVGAR